MTFQSLGDLWSYPNSGVGSVGSVNEGWPDHDHCYWLVQAIVVVHLLSSGHQDEGHLVANVVLLALINKHELSIGEGAYGDCFGDRQDLQVRLWSSHVGFNKAHLLFNPSHLQTEVNELFFLVELYTVVRGWKKGQGMCDHTHVNLTRPSSADTDNQLQRAQVTAYSSSCCGFLLGVTTSISGNAICEGWSGESAPLPSCEGDVWWRESGDWLCALPWRHAGLHWKLMVLMKDMGEKTVMSEHDGCSGEDSS